MNTLNSFQTISVILLKEDSDLWGARCHECLVLRVRVNAGQGFQEEHYPEHHATSTTQLYVMLCVF